MSADQELMCRQRTVFLIRNMGQRLQISRVCINTAIVFMYRFYAFHSFTRYHRNGIAAAALHLATKKYEQHCSLEDIVTVMHSSLGRNAPNPSQKAELAQDITLNESILQQTLGFELDVRHPREDILETSHLVNVSRDA